MTANEKIPVWFGSDDNTVSLYSSVRIARNFRSIPFSSSKEFREHKRIEKRVDNIIEKQTAAGDLIKRDISLCTHDQILRMQKLKILPDKRRDILNKFRLYVTRSADTFILLNYMDHITIFSYVQGDKVKKAYSNCKKILKLFRKVDFSVDESSRYLTSSVDYFGSGLKCFSVITLPFLRKDSRLADIIDSFDYNSLAYKKFWGLENISDDMIIITNKNSFEKDGKGTVEHFDRILKELKEISLEYSELSIKKAYELKSKCKKIIKYDFLTFKDFMEIYYKLSVLRLISKSDIKISCLNERIGMILLKSPKVSTPLRIRRSLVDELFETFEIKFK